MSTIVFNIKPVLRPLFFKINTTSTKLIFSNKIVGINVLNKLVKISVNSMGARGLPGLTATSNLLNVVAGETISGGKAVVIDMNGKAYVFNIANEAHYGKSCGIAKQSALLNESFDVITTGIAYEAGSGWGAGVAYYVSSTGLLTATPPANGITKLIAVGVASDSVLINNTMEVIHI